MNWQMLRCCVISGSWAARTLLLSTHSFGSKPNQLICQKSVPHPSPDGTEQASHCQDSPVHAPYPQWVLTASALCKNWQVEMGRID